ncbi:MAG: shikimate kinase [Coriobacteriia bacterium]
MNRNIYLIGFMGSGKTTVGGIVSDALGLPFVDLDALIEERAGRTIREVFTDSGEGAFRALERLALAEVSGSGPAVVACGGGVVTVAQNIEVMRDTGVVVLLDVRPDEVLSRVGGDDSRPLLDSDAEGIERLMRKRREAYVQAADAVVETSGKSAEAVAKEVTALAEGMMEELGAPSSASETGEEGASR